MRDARRGDGELIPVEIRKALQARLLINDEHPAVWERELVLAGVQDGDIVEIDEVDGSGEIAADEWLVVSKDGQGSVWRRRRNRGEHNGGLAERIDLLTARIQRGL